jgi:hypothetical protein
MGGVELSGLVLEGSIGYRAERARIVGPLTVFMGCSGPDEEPAGCGLAATSVRIRAEAIEPRCDCHRGGGSDELNADEVLAIVAARLELSYGVTVNQEGGTDGHR